MKLNTQLTQISRLQATQPRVLASGGTQQNHVFKKFTRNRVSGSEKITPTIFTTLVRVEISSHVQVNHRLSTNTRD